VEIELAFTRRKLKGKTVRQLALHLVNANSTSVLQVHLHDGDANSRSLAFTSWQKSTMQRTFKDRWYA